jgi:hypothetical protein
MLMDLTCCTLLHLIADPNITLSGNINQAESIPQFTIYVSHTKTLCVHKFSVSLNFYRNQWPLHRKSVVIKVELLQLSRDHKRFIKAILACIV